jgi:hypothetical protein
MNQTDSTTGLRLDRYGPPAFLLALVALVLLGIAFFSGGGHAAMQSYVFAFIFWGSMTIGCLALQLLHHTIRATWSLSVLRLLEAGGSPASLILLAVMFIPIALHVMMDPHPVYHWVHMDPADHVLHAKQFYLNVPFFIGRNIVYFVFWIWIASVIRSSSLRQDETLDPALAQKRTNFSAPMLVFFVLAITFTFTDWVMSLDAHWFSSIQPVLFLVGSALTALSLMVFITLSNRDKAPFDEIVNPKLTKDLGNMLFALTMLWTYMTLSQFLIQWSGNLPEETPYYLRRAEESWNILGTLVIFFQFFVPFLALMAPRTKRYAKSLMMVAMLIFVVRFFDIYWSVMPSVREGSFWQSLAHWTDYVALLGLGGLWFGMFALQSKKGALIPKHDTRLQEVGHAH